MDSSEGLNSQSATHTASGLGLGRKGLGLWGSQRMCFVCGGNEGVPCGGALVMFGQVFD
jgi:hypothetical protein